MTVRTYVYVQEFELYIIEKIEKKKNNEIEIEKKPLFSNMKRLYICT